MDGTFTEEQLAQLKTVVESAVEEKLEQKLKKRLDDHLYRTRIIMQDTQDEATALVHRALQMNREFIEDKFTDLNEIRPKWMDEESRPQPNNSIFKNLNF